MSDGLEATYKHLTQDRVFELYGGAQSVLSGLRRPEAPIDTTDRAFPSAAYQFTEADMLYKYLSTYPAHPSIHPSERKSSALSGGHSGTHSDGGFSLLEKMIDLIAMEKFEQFNKNPVRSTEKQSTQNSKKRDFNGNLKSPVQKEEIQLANQLPQLSNEGQKLVVYESLKTNNKLSKSQDWLGKTALKIPVGLLHILSIGFYPGCRQSFIRLVKRKGKMEYNPTTRSNEVIPLLQDVIDIFLNIEGENDAAGGFEKVTAYAILKFFNSFYEPIIAEFNTSQMGHRDIKKEIKLIDDMLEISHGQPHDSETTKKEQKFIQKIQKELQEEPQMKEWITNLMFQVFDVNYPN
ncbi:hypothetical protein H4Q26_000814 [Puccinia striiformis f. sp. tritici PST-130]|nr:hypothetical protein H4Q26_000814 [Puccinia striiformis f. sp. tritici PST-130]